MTGVGVLEAEQITDHAGKQSQQKLGARDMNGEVQNVKCDKDMSGDVKVVIDSTATIPNGNASSLSPEADSNANIAKAEVSESKSGDLEDVQDEDASENTSKPQEEGASVTENTEGVTKSEDGASDAVQDDMVVIQDTGFIIKLVVPGLEPFDVPVSSMELVQEIYQVLIDREDTCHRTCFSLQLDGITLDNFAELKTIEGLEEGSVLKVVEEPYTVREARIHVRHVRDLLKSVDHGDAYSGSDCSSLAFLNAVTEGDILDKRRSRPDSIDCTPPDYILPGSKERPIVPLHPLVNDLKVPQCLKVLTFSGWNPPPGNRKMHGDLLYLYVVTLEGKRYHLTASTRGFYVNQSTQDEFNPRAAPQKHLSHALIELLNQISPAFKRNFQILLKKRANKHPFERVATPYQVYSWMAPNLEHTVDSIRAEDAFSSRLGYEEHIPGQTRDWNEELQTTRELPRKTLPDRLIRERAIFKVHSDFVVAATRGAMAVIDGNIMAINPGEDSKMQMFLWNNIFFSLGFDVKDHYKDFGGDYAAYVAPSIDLQGVRAYASVDTEGLYSLGTVVIDYRGYRITAQSIIPGILEREQEQSVVYGSVDFGKTVITHEKYKELLQKTSSALRIRTHKVINSKNEEVEIYSSVECKGIIGNDGRHYVLDLLRTFPPDVNFLPETGDLLSDLVKKMGFPRPHPHRLACLRQELIDTFVETRYLAFVKHAAMLFQQFRLIRMQKQAMKEQEKEKMDEEKKADPKALENGESLESDTKECEKAETEDSEKVELKDNSQKLEKPAAEVTNEVVEPVEPTPEKEQMELSKEKEQKDIETAEAKKIVEALTGTDAETFEENSRDIVKQAAQMVGSLSDHEFSIRFNPDVFQPHVTHPDEEGQDLKKDKQLVKDAAEFLLVHQIPSFIRDCLDHTSAPIDGYTLSEALHHNGINIRYLGHVTKLVSKYPQLTYLHTICIDELICRAVKHLFQTYMQAVEMMSLSAAISHFLNCLLGSFPQPHAQVATEELQSQRAKKRNRKKNKSIAVLTADSTEWANETPRTLWKKISDEMKEYYDYSLECDSGDAVVEKYSVQKVSLLRGVCKRLGLQIALREYQLDNRHRQPFTEDDVINVFPTVKHIQPKASDAYHVFTTGQQKIQQGLLRDGYELISEALNLLNNVYGAMHPEIAACARLLARLNYIMGDYTEALAYQQRAVLMSERVLGIDHPNTITEYAHLALYCFANQQISTALKLMYRARYLALLCCGENHPEVALFDSNIGLILHAVGEFDLSLRFLIKALELNIKFFGARSLKVAMSYHLVARAYSCKGDFRTALTHEKEAYATYKQLLGEEHERTKESSECLRHLTQQAVKFQKTMNEIAKGDKAITIPPIQIQTPSLSNVLETLNLINGIVFVHISQEDIEKFREEMVRRQRQQEAGSSDSSADTSKSLKTPDSEASHEDKPEEDPASSAATDSVTETESEEVQR